MIEARHIATAIAALGAGLAAAGSARAGESTFCVTCLEPNRVYACTVATPRNDPGEKALRLYCIARSAAAGGHKNCGAARYDAASCKGVPKRYTYNGPNIPPALQGAIDKRLQKLDAKGEGAAASPQAQQAEPEKPDTLVDITTRTIKSTSEGAGEAVGGAIRGTGRVVGGAAKGTGRAVGTVAKGTGRAVGTVARSTGQVVGGAASYTYNCLVSLFRNCSGSEEPAAEDRRSGEDSEAPR